MNNLQDYKLYHFRNLKKGYKINTDTITGNNNWKEIFINIILIQQYMCDVVLPG